MNRKPDELWTECPRSLDETVTILGLEVEDLGLVALALVVASFFVSGLVCMAVAAAVYVALLKLKRGKPAGDMLHRAHALELMRLPGVLGPREKPYGIW